MATRQLFQNDVGGERYETMIAIVFGLIFKIVFLLAVGFVMKKKGVLSSQDQKSMTTVLMKIVVFFMIITQNMVADKCIQFASSVPQMWRRKNVHSDENE